MIKHRFLFRKKNIVIKKRWSWYKQKLSFHYYTRSIFHQHKQRLEMHGESCFAFIFLDILLLRSFFSAGISYLDVKQHSRNNIMFSSDNVSRKSTKGTLSVNADYGILNIGKIYLMKCIEATMIWQAIPYQVRQSPIFDGSFPCSADYHYFLSSFLL